ncbi:hypothetical protein Aple_076850 [Acrocarpospora pleiomorpha]|uniref:Winged helix DNA-binding domain-containing protein n=1 Tax=Acrocarpospora pleiomorpha TaxID=90975 RepID=A0A5M3XV70_9ACTN|nr:winged helix DNA-binding domain-containing protein [Acrocarpospora pleiomorpha]GES24786.1 hypothetical protein Aple_076850 [Acrocarpospora pleiomorpha]
MNDLWPARAVSQLLHRPPGTPAGIVRNLLAVQAQDARAAMLALRARGTGFRRTDVESALAEAEIVRAWGPRGTLHLIVADDLPWLLSLVRPGVQNAMRRLRQLGVEGQTPEQLVNRVDRAMRDQGPLTKAELAARLNTSAQGQTVIHLAALAAERGLLVLGPNRDGKATYVHTADWLGAPLTFEPDRDKALTELAKRYLHAHSPAGPEDLAAWSGISLGDARRAWKLARSPEKQPQTHPPADLVRLLPAFDEYLLGWRTREGMLSHVREVHPGGGIIRPTIIVNATVTGTWTIRQKQITPTFFAEQTPLNDEISNVQAFLA